MPKTALVRVKPDRLFLTVVVGLAGIAAGGYLFGLVIQMISFFSIIVAFGLGYGMGEAVSWASGRFHGPRLAAWASGCAALAVLFPFVSRGVYYFGASSLALDYVVTSGGFWKMIWIAAAAYGAWQRNV
jgi:hypothetical protein